MQKKFIPKTSLEVSQICLGTMTFGTPVAEAEAITLTHSAIDHGINFIDTANMYEGYTRVVGSAGGIAEEILGKALKGRRGKVVLATKLGMKVGAAPEDEGASPAAVRKQLDMSLRRLATDCIEIYYLHKPDEKTPLADTLGALNEAMLAGKIKHYGISNYSAQQTAELLRVADAIAVPRPMIHQPPYSLLKPDIEKDLLPLCRQEMIAVAPYQVLQGGLLTGKYRRGQATPPGSRQSEKPQWLLGSGGMTDELFARIEGIEEEARTLGRSLLEHALKATLEKPAVISLVLGAKRIDQIESCVAALNK
jgi:aryl-alcohol dehydrogenase-like predicted oxidoreductase